MNDEVSDLAVIGAALKAAMPGPWVALDPWEIRSAPTEEMICDVGLNSADANLIANAPTWLAELVERVKVAESERDLAIREARLSREATDKQVRSRRRFEARARSAETSIERVRAAVERAKTRGGGYAGILHSSEILRALDGAA